MTLKLGQISILDHLRQTGRLEEIEFRARPARVDGISHAGLSCVANCSPLSDGDMRSCSSKVEIALDRCFDTLSGIAC